jgi:heat shock protein HtpX
VFVGIISLIGDILIRSPRAFLYMGGGRRGSSRSSSSRGGGGGAIVLIVIAVVIFLIARFLAIVLRFALSQKREYLADAGSVDITKNADAMISALHKVAGHSEIQAPEQVQALFLDHQHAGFAELFATHPPIEERIEALEKYAGGVDVPSVAPPLNAAAQSTPIPPPRKSPWA